MTVSSLIRNLITNELNKVDNISDRNWSDLKWNIITQVMIKLNKPGECLASQSTVSDFYDIVFYDYPKN